MDIQSPDCSWIYVAKRKRKNYDLFQTIK